MKKEKELKKFIDDLYKIAQRDTAYPACQANWSKENKFCGHCAIIVAAVYNKFGGKIKRGIIKEQNLSHYWNEIDGQEIDPTGSQFRNEKLTIKEISYVSIDRILQNKETLSRYNILLERYNLYHSQL